MSVLNPVNLDGLYFAEDIDIKIQVAVQPLVHLWIFRDIKLRAFQRNVFSNLEKLTVFDYAPFPY